MKLIKTMFFTVNLLWSVTAAMNAAVTFTVAPPAVSNTYPGVITLQVTGLTNTETVVVQKFLDANTNDVVDAGDLLVQQFDLTDGSNSVIGGVTNLNVPGDNDPAGGQITAALNFKNGNFVQSIIGRYIFVLSSPGGHFAPLTNLFAVTNFPYAQKITGTVLSNSAPVPDAVVLLFPPSRGSNHGPGNPVAATVADNSGSYSVEVPPGTYVPMAFKSNYVAALSASPIVTLTNAQTVNTNLILTNATASISGQVVDAGNPGLGLPGLFVPVSTNGQITVGFSDTNGDFLIRVRSGTWSLEGEPAGLILHGYVGYQSGTNIAAGTTGVIIPFPKATAMFYGSVKDNLGNPLVGLDVSANDTNNQYQADGYTDTNGNYAVGIVGGLGSGDSWQLQVDNGGGGSGNPTNYIYTQTSFQQTGTNLNVGQALQQNFTGILATNHIIGNVQFKGTNVVGVGVDASATIGGLVYNQYVDTDTNGNYSLNVASGDWSISLNCDYGNDSLNTILGSGNYQCPNNQNVTINHNDATNNFAVSPCGGLQILTTNLPVGEVNIFYDQFLQGSSCNGNLSWSVFSGSTDGLNLSANGELSGVPGSSGVFDFTVQANDGTSTTNQSLSLIISNAVTIVTASLPDGTNGMVYSQQLQAGDGVPFNGPSTYTWSLVSGTLPANLTLATNGLLSGTAATTGTFNFNVEVTDRLNGSYQRPLTLTLNSQSSSLQITTISLPNATQNAAYNTTLTATGGQPPYTWSLAPGSASLPYYLSLDSSNGVISGTPVSAGTSSFIVRVTDTTAATVDQFLSLTVDASTNSPVVVLNPVQYQNGQFQFTFATAPGTSYTLQVSTNLANWVPVSTFTGSGGPLTVSDLTAGSNLRFYRLIIGP